MNRRLIIIIIGLILILTFVGLLIYSFQRDQVSVNNQSGPLQIKKVVDEVVISPINAINNESIWYFNLDGHLFEVSTNGSNLSEFPLPVLSANVSSVLWPKTGSDFITIGSSNNRTVINYYDSVRKLFSNLPQNVQFLDWMPDSKRILYVWKADDAKTQQLVLANADGSGFKKVADLYWPDLAVKVSPDGKTALLFRRQVQSVNKIYTVNLETGVIATVIDEGKNDGALWLNNDQILFTAAKKVYKYNLKTKETTDLNLNTSINKLAIDQDAKFIYAAVAKSDNVGETFVKFDINNNSSQSYFEPQTEVKVKSVLLIGSTVYYVDSTDGKLYSISR